MKHPAFPQTEVRASSLLIASSPWLFAVAMLMTVLIYLPGLHGSYFFDDYPNIVDNTRLHVDSLDWRQWWQAIWSSPSSDLRRPLASLSFALDYYISGLDPWSMKATNLAIHLLNGWLLYLLLAKLATLLSSSTQSDSRRRLLALLVSAAWLAHPINATTVLYIVQRMESLANLFVLAGLSLYIAARVRLQAQNRGALWRLWLGVPFLTALGCLAKESAALLPLLALAIEVALPHSDDTKHTRRNLAAFFVVFLILPFALGLTWLLPKVLSAEAFRTRSFTLAQRLLTEPRVILDYVDWILVPLPGSFSFYHDTIPVSTSLLQPGTTLPAIVALILIAVAGLFLRTRFPIAALGIFWFLAAHILTATIVPLELAFDHRNYFASAGLILAAFDLLLPSQNKPALPVIRYIAIGAFLALCCFTTLLRATEWRNPVSLALTEARRHSDSPRATYEYGRTLVVLSDYKVDSPLVPKAFEALSAAANVPGSGILPEVGLIMLASRTGRSIDSAWWQGIQNKLLEHRPTASDDEALKNITLCQREGRCAIDDDQMLQVYLAAVGNGGGTPASLYSYAIFAYGRLHDRDLALRLVREAADKAQGDPQYRLNLVDFLVSVGDRDAAITELATLKKQDHYGALALDIARIEHELITDKYAPSR